METITIISRYAFLDESGTLQHHKIMTVALVMLEGAHTAQKLHLKIAKSIFRNPRIKRSSERDKWYAKQELHFTDMNYNQKLVLGLELGQATIEVIVGSHWYTKQSIDHEHRFLMYKKLVKAVINKALVKVDKLTVSIAKQGGWESYGHAFLEELRVLPEQFSKSGNFRRGEFVLSSPSKAGQQIADFYVTPHNILPAA